MKKIITITLFSLMTAMSINAQPKLSKENIDEVLAAMTLEEKAELLVGAGWGSMIAGSMTASDATLVPGAAGTTNAIPRLGIPKTVLADGPAGLRIEPRRPGTDKTFFCTGFPVGTVLASTWDVDVVRKVTEAMGNEVLEYGTDVLLAPGQNIHRNPLCGRNFEYFSEDPFLSGKISAAYVKGIQSQGVGTSIKHFAVNNQEVNRMADDAIVGERALREIYLKNFEITVKESDPWTVMSSYNQINGSFAQQSHDLLTKILRDDWGFNGIVMTDWGSKDGTVKAVAAGNDLMEPGMPQEKERIVAAVKDGSLSIEDVDRNVRHMLEYIVRTPRFNGYKYSNNPDLAAHAEVSRKAAAEGMILLKNNRQTLPLSGGKVALFGIQAYETVAGGTGSGNVNKPYVTSIKEGLENAGFELIPEVTDLYVKYAEYEHAKEAANKAATGWSILLGGNILPDMAVSETFIGKQAKAADVAIVVIGRNAGEGDDRKLPADFNLTADETALLNNVCNSFHVEGKRVIVVMNIGGVIETASWKSLPDAILLAWTPGQEAGNAIADLLTGKANPSGKLPMTFPMAFMDHPSSLNFPYDYTGAASFDPMAGIFGGGKRAPRKNVDYTDYAEGIWVGYRYFDSANVEVSYPFGYGLSYTQFTYSNPVVKVGKDGGLTASIVVTNSGKVAGKEAVQLYVSAPAGGMVKPVKELKAFAKTALLEPGQSQTLTFEVSNYDLASFNEEASRWESAAGTYAVHFAASSEDVRNTVSVKIAKAATYSVSSHALAPAQPKNSSPELK